jgi:multidrug efflux pump subunit AcrA (membrane-fusion protein)
MFKKILQFTGRHKIISGLVIIALIAGGYFWYTSSRGTITVTKYVVENATTGTVDTSVSGSGQIESSKTVDVKSDVSESVTSVKVKVGDHVSAGQLLVQLDSTNEEKTLKSAKLALESAKLSNSELGEITTSTLLQDKSSVTKAQQTLATASTTVVQDYQSGFDTVTSAMTSMQDIMLKMNSFILGNDFNASQNDPAALANLMPSYMHSSVSPYEQAVLSTYATAQTSYAKAVSDYHAASRTSDQATLDALFSGIYQTTQDVNSATRATHDFLNYIIYNYPSNQGVALPTLATTFQTNFETYLTTTNTVVSNILNITTSIDNDKIALKNDETSLELAQESLNELVAGPTDNEVLSSQISLQSAQNTLENAETDLADTSLTAPIAGTVSEVDAIVGETVPSPAVVIVSDGMIASVTLDESDAINVAVGDPATLTFDAIDGLSLAGTVTQVDPVGTVSSGVVSYTEEIGFTNSSSTVSIKPGMSVTADIITKIHQNVITVPSTALVTMGSSTYILEPSVSLSASEIASSTNGGIVLNTTPKRVLVATGLVGDSDTEILSGISEGDQIITKTIKSSSASTATASTKTTSATKSSSALKLLSGSGGGGGGEPPSGGGGM